MPYHVAPAAATAPMLAAVMATAVPDGIWIRDRNDTGLEKASTGQPRSFAIFFSARSGLTADGWPTASSIGRSVIESL